MPRRLPCLACVLLFPTLSAAADPSIELAKLQGTWEITGMIDDGELVNQSLVRQRLVEDGRISIKGHILSMIRAGAQAKREFPFVINVTEVPKQLDIAGTEKTGGKGIYMLDGDSLVVCLSGPESMTRPTDFSSKPESHELLLFLKRVKPEITFTAATTSARTTASSPALPPPSRDAEYRRLLIGTWGHQDDERVQMTTFNPDGTFASKLTWKRSFQRLFHEDVRTSGTWKIEDGILILRVTSSTQNGLAGQIYSYRIYSMSSSQARYTDQEGRLRTEWKVP